MTLSRNEMTLEYKSQKWNYAIEIIGLLLVIFTIVMNRLTSVHKLFHTFYWAGVIAFGVLWVVGYIIYTKHTKLSVIKSDAMQIVISGYVAILIICTLGKMLHMDVDIMIVIVGIVLLGLNFLGYSDIHMVLWNTLLLFPYIVFSVVWVLIAGFTSTFVLLLWILNGKRGIMKDGSDDIEYYGNSNHSDY